MDTESPMKKDGDGKLKGVKLTRTQEYKDYLKRKKEFQAKQGHGHDAAYSDFKGKKFHTTIFNMDGSPVSKESGDKKPPTKMKKGEGGAIRPKSKEEESKEMIDKKEIDRRDRENPKPTPKPKPGVQKPPSKSMRSLRPMKMKKAAMKMSHKK